MFTKKIAELTPPVADFIRLAGRMSDEKGISAYIVGGFIRDFFGGVDNFDVDLVVEGDGIALAESLSQCLKLRLVTHKRFGTATLLGLEGFKVDIASARREIYEKPAALPTVSFGGIEDDLFRRDFTVNAMAVSINEHSFGKIVDFYGGRKDLEKGLVRALHPLSFRDDPTRILRAVRFEQRFCFKIEKATLSWIKEAVRQKMLTVIQKHRLRDELVLMVKEKSPLKNLRRLYEITGFSYIAPGLHFQKAWGREFEDAERKILWFKEHFFHKKHLDAYVLYLCLFFYPLGLKQLQGALSAFAFHKAESSKIISLKENFVAVQRELSRRHLRPSTVYRLLKPLSYEVILLVMVLAKNTTVAQRVEDFLFFYDGAHLHLKGDDLHPLGIKPGPRYKKILQELLFAKIDGKVKTREEEWRLAQELAHSR